jgi:hypothetical protein
MIDFQTFNRDGKTIVLCDASLFKTSSCLLRMFYQGVLGIRSRLNNNDMEIGSAFHKFRATFRRKGKEGFGEGLNEALAYWQNTPMVVKSNKKYLNDNFLIKMCNTYAAKYAKDDFELVTTDRDYNDIPAGTALIEPVTRFMFPYYVDDDVEILIAGTIDELGKWRNGIHCIVDAKTTSSWNIEDYFRGYDMSPQLICYRWAWEQYAIAYPDSFFAKIFESDIGTFIDGVFYAGAEKDIICKRSNVFLFPRDQIVEFDNLVAHKVEELVREVRNWRQTSKVPMRFGLLNGACETPYGRCLYFNACAARDQVTREIIFNRDFKQHAYNPMEHGA